MGSSHLHVVWDNHISNLQAVLYEFYNRHSLADVTISCKDGTLKAHKIILSACSPYFETVFQENPCEHPVVILKEISCHEMQILLQLMYRGSTDVLEEDISDIIQTANELKVKGFVQAAVKNLAGETDKLENDSEVDQLNSSSMLPTNDAQGNKDEAELHVLKDTRQGEEICHVQDDDEGSNGIVDINNSTTTSDKVNKPTAEEQQAIIITSTYSVEQHSETTRARKRQKGADVRTSSCGEDFLVELECKSTKRHQRENGLKTRRKAAESQDSLSCSSEDEKMVCDRPRQTRSSKNVNSEVNAVSIIDIPLEPQSNFGDRSSRKELCFKSVDDKLLNMIPEIQIKEERVDGVDFGLMSTHYNTRNFKDKETVRQSNSGNFVNTHLSCTDISDIATLVRRSEIAAKPHECEFCGLSFSRASHLARHRRVHTGEKPFICILCLRKFTRQDKLKLHAMKYHSLDVREGKYWSYVSPPKVSSGATEDELRETGRGDISLPFGDTSYLSSISFGQQKHTDSAVIAEETLDSNADELLHSVRQLGECTIQAITKQESNS